MKLVIRLTAFLAACTTGTTHVDQRATRPLNPTVRDSAGVRIVAHPADALARAPLAVLDSVPVVTYRGSAEDLAADISTIRSLSFLSDGRLVGYDRTSGTLVLLDTDGTVKRFGRQGAGPLELGRTISAVVTPGDTVYLTDRQNSRYTIFHPDSGLLRSLSLLGTPQIANARLLTHTDGGVFLVSQPKFEPQQRDMNSVIRPVFEYSTWRVGDDSAVSRFTASQGEFYQKTFHGKDGSMGVQASHLAFSPATTVVGGRDGFVSTPGDRWHIEWRDTSGTLTQILSLPIPREALTDEMWRRYVEEGVRSQLAGEPALDPDSVLTANLASRHSDSLPVLDGLELSPDGTIWVRDREIPGDSAWAITAFDQQGHLLGRYKATGGPHPAAYGNGRLLFRTEDDLGIATLSIYRVKLPK